MVARISTGIPESGFQRKGAKMRSEVRDRRQPGWFYIDNEILERYASRIKATGIAVYASLAKHANNETSECWPSIPTMAQESGTSIRTVQRVLKVLESERLITIERARTDSGDYDHNVYTLLNVKPTVEKAKPRPEPVKGGGVRESPPTEGVVSESHHGGVRVAHELYSENYTQGGSLSQIWITALAELREQMTHQTFDQWLAGSLLLHCEDGHAIIAVETEYQVDWLSTRWITPIKRTLSAISDVPDLRVTIQAQPTLF